MKKVAIGFSCPQTWKIGAEALKWYMDTEYSHAYIRYQDSHNRDIVFQAAHGTVHPILFENFTKENKVIKEFIVEFTDEEYEKLRNYCYEKMGEKYAYLDLIVIFAHDCFKKIGINFNDNVSGYICSELAASVLVDIKCYNFDKSINLIRPDDLFKKLQ
jgi:hypothetical protein